MATSKLQRYVSQQLSIHFGQYTIKENIRPDWLITPDGERLELDFLIEELNVAIEVQGKQHYIYIPYFHGNYRNFLKRLQWDNLKKDRCRQLGIRLIEISSDSDDFISIIYETVPNKKEFWGHNIKSKMEFFNQDIPIDIRLQLKQQKLERTKTVLSNLKYKFEKANSDTRKKELIIEIDRIKSNLNEQQERINKLKAALVRT